MTGKLLSGDLNFFFLAFYQFKYFSYFYEAFEGFDSVDLKKKAIQNLRLVSCWIRTMIALSYGAHIMGSI